MKPGTDRAALVAQLEPLARRVQLRLGGPAPYVTIMERHRPVVKPLREQLVGAIATPLWILLGTVAIVFLIACANVASLFTVRSENRRRDLAVRRALGAGRADLVRSQLSEALLLGAAGGVAGALIAWAGVPLLVRVGRGIVGRRTLTRDALVVVQTASALVLLVGSALLMRRFWQLSNVDAGYNTEDIFTFQIAASRPDLNDRASMSRFQYALMDRLKALPGVESVGFVNTLPLDEGAGSQNITTPRITASGAEAPLVRRGRRRRLLPDDGYRAVARPLLRAGRGRARATQCDHQPVGR